MSPSAASPSATPGSIRLATAGDLDALAALETACFGGEAWSHRLITEELEASTALVLVTEGPEARPPEPSLAYAAFRRAADEAELLRVATAPAARRRGLAAALLAAGLERLRAEGAAACFLEVEAGNAPAIALYRRLGFVPSGRRSRYYATGAGALLMRLDLAAPAER